MLNKAGQSPPLSFDVCTLDLSPQNGHNVFKGLEDVEGDANETNTTLTLILNVTHPTEE